LSLAPTLQSTFDKTLKEISAENTYLLNTPGLKWVEFISQGLGAGGGVVGGKRFDPFAELIGKVSGSTEEQNALLERVVNPKKDGTLSEKTPIWAQIACREIISGNKNCDDARIKLANPFDSRNFLVKTPLIYASGSRDPAVNIEHAYHGFMGQSSSIRKYFVTIQDGGHANFMFAGNCQEPFWRSVFEGANHFDEAISKCGSSVSLRQ
jgi:hypothetical protein